MKCKYCGREVIRARWYDYWSLFPFGLINVILTRSWYKHKVGVFNHNCKAIFLGKKVIE